MLIDSGKPTSKFLTYPPEYLQQQNSTHFLRTKVRSQFPTQRILTRSAWTWVESPISSVVLVTLCLKLMPYNFIIMPHTWQCPVSGYEDKLAPGESLFAPLQMASDSNIIISLISLSSPSSSHGTIVIVMVIINWHDSNIVKCHHFPWYIQYPWHVIIGSWAPAILVFVLRDSKSDAWKAARQFKRLPSGF